MFSLLASVNEAFHNVYPLVTLTAMSGKDSGLRVRVEKALRSDFLEACHSQDRPAAQVIREFMREYVARTVEKNNKVAEQGRSSDHPVRT